MKKPCGSLCVTRAPLGRTRAWTKTPPHGATQRPNNEHDGNYRPGQGREVEQGGGLKSVAGVSLEGDVGGLRAEAAESSDRLWSHKSRR